MGRLGFEQVWCSRNSGRDIPNRQLLVVPACEMSGNNVRDQKTLTAADVRMSLVELCRQLESPAPCYSGPALPALAGLQSCD